MTPRAALSSAVVLGMVAVFGMSFFGGIAPLWSALFGLPVTLFALMVMLTPAGVEPVWAPLPEPPTRSTTHLAAGLTSRLSEVAARPRRFRTRLQPRLVPLAIARLRRAGIDDLADPRAPSVLGADLYRLVTDPAATLPDPHTTAALIARLEED